jgi:hypothetical protein
MLMEVDECMFQNTCSVRKKTMKNKLHYSSKKALEKLRMRATNKVFKFRGPSKIHDFGYANIVDVADVSDKVLQVVKDVEELMNTDVNNSRCVIEENVSYVLP